MALRDRLIEEAERKMHEPPEPISFSGQPEADALLNDLTRFPHAFVIGCIMDRQISSERAWRVPWDLKARLGDFGLWALVAQGEEGLKRAVAGPPRLHRFYGKMGRNLWRAVKRIEGCYGGDATQIWANTPSSAAIVRRFLEFDGVAQKIATMAANILVRDFRVPVRDRYSIDISLDSHVPRVFRRMGFVPTGASGEYVVYRARELYPEYPGIFDLALWELGKSVCRLQRPRCDGCDFQDLCENGRRWDA